MAKPDASNNPARLLRGGALVFLLIGGGITAWLLKQAFAHPEIQASQFSFSAPLWWPAILFVVLATVAGITLLLRAARRVDRGEDLFAQRHRRHPEERDDSE